MALVLTPGEIADFQRTIADGIEALNIDIKRCADFDPAKLAAWIRFRERFTVWLRDNSSTWALMWGATMDGAERYAGMLEQWRAVYRRQCAREPSAPPTPTESSPPRETEFYEGLTSTLKWVGIFALGGMALYALTPAIRSAGARRRRLPRPAPVATRPMKLQLFDER